MSVKPANILCPVSLYNHEKSRNKQAELKTGTDITGPKRERSIAVGFGYFDAEQVEWGTITGTFRQRT